MGFKNTLDKINNSLAVRLTIMVGSIWAFYVFFLYGFVPILWPQTEVTVLYWSNFLQLIFLPLITVGTNVLNKANEKRSAQDHKALMNELKIIKTMHSELRKVLTDVD